MNSGWEEEGGKQSWWVQKPLRADWNETETPHMSLELWLEKKANSTAGRDMWLEEQSLIERSKVSSSKTRSKEKPRQTYSSSNNKHVSYIQM